MPQLPPSPFPPRGPHGPRAPHDAPPGPWRGDPRGLPSFRLQRHIAAPPGLPAARPATRQERDLLFDALLRDAGRQSRLSAPPDLTAAIRDTLSHLNLDQPAHTPAHAPSRPIPAHLADLPHALAEAWSEARTLIHYHELSERQRRVALGGASTLGLAALCALGLALDPSEVFALLGIFSAVVLTLLAVGHLLSAAVAAVLGSGLLAIAVVALYTGLAALWVRLVRSPLEA